MDTATKIAKAATHAKNANVAAADLIDWLDSTPPADWDADVIIAQAKILEAAGCHVRRTLAAAQAAGLID